MSGDAKTRDRRPEKGWFAMKMIAVITARGGSKRLPGKNIRNFCGKPVLSYSIRAARESGLFEQVMVSTDDGEIARLAESHGAKIPFMRTPETAGDYATTADVMTEVLENYKKAGHEFDAFCCIYPTAPFVTAGKLRQAAKLLEQSGADSVMPVVRYSFPPQRSVVIHNGFLRYLYPENEKVRSQDLEPVYHDCGQFYLCRTAPFFQYRSFITPKTVPMPVAEEEVQDIDTESDWNLAELKYVYTYQKNEWAGLLETMEKKHVSFI